MAKHTVTCQMLGCHNPATNRETVDKIVNHQRVIAFYYYCDEHATVAAVPMEPRVPSYADL